MKYAIDEFNKKYFAFGFKKIFIGYECEPWSLQIVYCTALSELCFI